MYRVPFLELVDEPLSHAHVVCGTQDIVHETRSDDLAPLAIFFDEHATVTGQLTKAEVADQVIGIFQIPGPWRSGEPALFACTRPLSTPTFSGSQARASLFELPKRINKAKCQLLLDTI